MADEIKEAGAEGGGAHSCSSVPGIPFKPRYDRRRNPGGIGRTARLAQQMMGEASKEVFQTVIAMAKAGDVVAAKMVIDRAAPAPKNRPVAFDLPKNSTTPADTRTPWTPF